MSETIEKIETSTMEIFDVSKLSEFTGSAYIICRDRMIYGIIENGKITDHNNKEISDWQTYLIEARFYNNENEIKVFNRMSQLFYRNSDALSGLEKITTQQILLGTTYTESGNFILATEDRGTEIYIPKCSIEGTVDIKKWNENKQRIALQIEQYIDYENNLATIVDYRFINYKII